MSSSSFCFAGVAGVFVVVVGIVVFVVVFRIDVVIVVVIFVAIICRHRRSKRFAREIVRNMQSGEPLAMAQATPTTPGRKRQPMQRVSCTLVGTFTYCGACVCMYAFTYACTGVRAYVRGYLRMHVT